MRLLTERLIWREFEANDWSASGYQLIGNCGIRMASPDAYEADIGYELDPQHWEQGYATETARAIVRFGFT